MTKREAVSEWRSGYFQSVRADYEADGVRDWPARREAWNNFTDALCKEGRITSKQYDSWTSPRECGS